jgi:hypothetical protein
MERSPCKAPWSVPGRSGPSRSRRCRRDPGTVHTRFSRHSDSVRAKCRSSFTETCKSSAGASPPRRSQLRMASAIVASISIRSHSSSPVSCHADGSAELQPCVNVSRRRGRSPLFHAERRILARCSDAAADFIFMIMRIGRRTYRTDRRQVECFLELGGCKYQKWLVCTFLIKKV